MGFSPVAGIQWVETPLRHLLCLIDREVSVPLPGFSGLRPVAAANGRLRVSP